MKLKLLLLAALTAVLMAPAAQTFAADTTNAATASTNSPVMSDLNALVTRINLKLQQGRTNENDLAEDIHQFDVLFAKYDKASADERAQILMMKARLYLEVLGEPEKAIPVLRQIKTLSGTAQANGSIDGLIASLQDQADRKKIRDSLVPGAAFPNFDAVDLSGKSMSPAHYKGKVVLVNFWATWCPPCVMETPELQKAYEKYHDSGLQILGISLDEDRGQLEKFIKSRNIPWPQQFEGKRWDNTLAKKYGVDATPTSYLIGRDGKIITRFEGLASPEELEPEIAKALQK